MRSSKYEWKQELLNKFKTYQQDKSFYKSNIQASFPHFKLYNSK